MRFLKNQNINRFTINDQTLMTNPFGKAVMGITGGLRLPQGTTAERPINPANGAIRFNTTNNWIEFNVSNTWYSLNATVA